MALLAMEKKAEKLSVPVAAQRVVSKSFEDTLVKLAHEQPSLFYIVLWLADYNVKIGKSVDEHNTYSTYIKDLVSRGIVHESRLALDGGITNYENNPRYFAESTDGQWQIRLPAVRQEYLDALPRALERLGEAQ